MNTTSKNVKMFLNITIKRLFLLTGREPNSISEFYKKDSLNSHYEQWLSFIRDAIRQLPPQLRTVIEQRFIENKSAHDIYLSLGIRQSAFYTRLQKACLMFAVCFYNEQLKHDVPSTDLIDLRK